ncbi:MAG: DNA polymerase III subunit delta' [Marinibacterium sp.]|nr:DNA polymerase III subunit delta' [Marinibacterium sp.]
MTDDTPRADQVPDAPHPRETETLFGHAAAEQAVLDAIADGRLHHAWLITGPQGIGKATLAWRMARHLLASPPDDGGMFGAPEPAQTLDISPDHPVARRILAEAEPGLALVRRSANDKTGRLRDEIVVDDIRALHRFFGLSSADGGRRVVIVDAADDMNVSAANALLKMLEEPPARAILLLVSHQPSRLLPTIRSRCRTLRLSPLAPDDMAAALAQAGADALSPEQADALAALAAGSVGTALRLLGGGGLAIYAELVALLGTLPRLDRPRALKLADSAAARNAGDRFDLILTLTDILLTRLARTGALGAPPLPQAAPHEAEILTRLAASPRQGRAWADLAARVSARARHGQAVNLDPAALVLDTVFKMQETASG